MSIHPQIMLCGHIHKAYISRVGGEKDYNGQQCPVIVASQKTEDAFLGGAITLYSDHCNVTMTGSDRSTLFDENLGFNEF